MKVVGFTFRPEDEVNLKRLRLTLGWNGSQIVRELLARAVVQTQPTVSVELSAGPAGVESAHVG